MRLRHLIPGTLLATMLLCSSALATWPLGGAGFRPVKSNPTQPEVPGNRAKIVHGFAYPPSNAPIQVKRAIWAGDRIRFTPYVYGGGHGTWNDSGYDCSGSVSYVLRAAGLVTTSLDSSGLGSWGSAGWGRWMTVFTNSGHTFIEIAGVRFDTSAAGDPHPDPAGSGPRWHPLLQDTSGFSARHPSDY